jgi:hypothetical protein
MEHPVITRINRTGYPEPVKQVKHYGIDIFGHEIEFGDEVIEHNGELILKENLRDYLEDLDFVFKVAE